MIIGIAGMAGSGKSTVADHLVAKHGFVSVSLADPIKRFCREVFDFSDEQLWGPSEKRNEPDKRYPRTEQVLNFEKGGIPDGHPEMGPLPVLEDKVRYLTPRHALQQLGTEWGRACYENVWVDYALKVAKKILFGQEHKTHNKLNYDQRLGLYPWYESAMKPIKGVVIPDVRFKNEVDAILAAGGHVWRIHRGAAGLTGAAGQHQSEVELDGIPKEAFAINLYNDSTLDVLYALVDKSIPRGQ